MVKYSNTGKFTARQRQLASEIEENIKKLRASGISIYGKGPELVAYKSKDMEHAVPLHLHHTSRYSIKPLSCGMINDSGADDEEYFEEGYIDEED